MELGAEIQLKRWPKTGKGSIMAEHPERSDKFLIQLEDGRRMWAHEMEFIVSGDEDFRVE